MAPSVGALPGSRRDALLLGLLLVGAFVHLSVYHPALPDPMASHFDAAGKPDGWMDKSSFFAVAIVSYLFTGGLFVVLGRFLPAMPTSMINLPNREYWLAPTRRAETLEDLTRRMMRIGAATMILMIGIFHQTFEVNLGRAQGLEGAWLLLAAYGIYTVIWCVGLLRRFRRPRS